MSVRARQNSNSHAISKSHNHVRKHLIVEGLNKDKDLEKFLTLCQRSPEHGPELTSA